MGAASAVAPTFEAVRPEPAERAPRERLLLAVRPVLPVLRPPAERPAVERLAGFFAVERAAGFFAVDLAAEEREVEAFAAVDFLAAGFFAAGFLAVDFLAAVARAAGFFAVERAVVVFFAAGFFAADLFAVEVDFLAVDLVPADLRPADFALDLAVAFLVAEDFEDLPADLPLDVFLPAAAMSRSFLKMEMMH